MRTRWGTGLRGATLEASPTPETDFTLLFRTALLAVIATLAIVAVAGAKGHPSKPVGTGKAAAACKAERTANPTAFTTKYANSKGKHAAQRCVRQHLKAARATCKAERTADVAAFNTKYGKAPRRACIRQHAADPIA